MFYFLELKIIIYNKFLIYLLVVIWIVRIKNNIINLMVFCLIKKIFCVLIGWVNWRYIDF